MEQHQRAYIMALTRERWELLVGCALAFLPLEGRFANLLAKSWLVPVIAIAGAFSVSDSPFLSLGGYGVLGLIGAWIITALQKRCWLVVPLEIPQSYISVGSLTACISGITFFLALPRPMGSQASREICRVGGHACYGGALLSLCGSPNTKRHE